MAARDAIKLKVRLQDVLTKEGVQLDQAGPSHLKALCPLHSEKTPSFYLNTAKDLFFCHGCQTGGDLFKYVQLRQNISFSEAVRVLAEQFSINIASYTRTLTEEEAKQSAYYQANWRALEYWRRQDQKPLHKWMEKRGISDEVIAKFDLAFSTSVPSAEDLNINDETWDALGFGRTGLYRNAIIIPVFDLTHRVAGFRIRPLNPGDGPKVIGPHANHPLPIPTLYGLQNAIPALRSSGGKLVIVEGEPDAWSLSAGWPAVAAAMGTKIQDRFLRDYLGGYGIQELVVVPDGDDGGLGWADRLARQSGAYQYPIRLVELPNGYDPDEHVIKFGVGALVKLINEAPLASEWAIERVISKAQPKTTTEKLECLTEARDYIIAARPIEAGILSQRLAEHFGLDTYLIDDFLKQGESDTPSSDASIPGERVLLSAMIQDELARHTIAASLDKSAFFLRKHADLCAVLSTMDKDRLTIGPDTVLAELTKLAMTQLKPLVDDLLTVDHVNFEYHLNDVRERAMRRRALTRIDRIKRELMQPGTKPRGVLETGVSDLAQMTVHDKLRINTSASIIETTMLEIAERMRSPNLIVGWDLGPQWPILNRVLLGLQKPRYFVLAAPQGTGKTAFACNIVNRVCGDLKVPTMWFTFEMPPEALQYRMLSIESGVKEEDIRSGTLTDPDMEQVNVAATRIHSMPLIWSREGRTIEAMESIIRSHVLKSNVEMVVVDYIQLMYTNEEGPRYQQLEYISGRLQTLIEELGIVGLVLCQINREGAKSTMARVEDVGGAYRIGQDADIFLILQECQEEEMVASGLEGGNLKMLLDKHRYGRSDIFTRVCFEKETLRMREANQRG